MNATSRSCPFCAGRPVALAFPFAIRFADVDFSYLRCGSCSTVYVDPVPDEATFARMYAKSNYHDKHYSSRDLRPYRAAAQLLGRFAPAGARVLDYGCGFGAFLSAAASSGFRVEGVEYDEQAAAFAAENSGCSVQTAQEFLARPASDLYDVIHLGDVLEHLAEPAITLRQLLQRCKPSGLLFAEGPLEANASPVYWASCAYGGAKRLLGRRKPGEGTPTHLFRTSAEQQLAFFRRVVPHTEVLHWEVTEDGWPYSAGGLVKRGIARMAASLGGKTVAGRTFGNRFRGVFRVATGTSNTGDGDLK
jgi:SAM-dependent methyltransferase